jgi:hypothetical protein
MSPAALLLAASSLAAQTLPDPSDILNRARFHIAALTRGLPKYACIQTIDRAYFERPRNTDCDRASADKKRGRTPLSLRVTDRVRIEVSQGEGQEIHSWPGAAGFETGSIDELIRRGPASTGGFGGYLIDIFDNGAAQFSFSGSKTEAGRAIFTYGYRVDQELSHYQVGTDTGWVISGYDGTFDIDIASLDLVRLTIDTISLPPETGLCEAQSSLAYSPTQIDGSEFLLPREASLHLIHLGTLETNSTSVFSGCRPFKQEAPAPMALTNLSLPVGTFLKLRLNAAIDSNIAAAGDAVTATIVEPVRDPKLHAIILPPGGVVNGRITRMEHWLLPKRQFMIAIHWDSIMQDEKSIPIIALLPERPARLGAGQRTPMSVAIPGRTVYPGEIEGRRPPSLPELREVLPLVPTEAARCVVPEGQELVLTIPPKEGAVK